MSSIVFLVILIASSSSIAFRIVGYLPEWEDDYDLVALVGKVTDLNFFSQEIDPLDGSLVMNPSRLPQKYKIDALKEEMKRTEKHTNLLVTIGGWERSIGGFQAIIDESKKRENFVASLLNALDEYGLDGVDLDWEYPATESQWKGLGEVTRMIKAANPNVIVTMAIISTYGHNAFIQRYGIEKNVDLFNVMAYDQPGQHSTYEFADQLIRAWSFYNLPMKKLTLGLPFYGKDIYTSSARTYSQIVNAYGLTDPSIDQVDNVYFNGIDTIRLKMDLVKRNEMAGVMIWEIGQDVDYSNPMSLLNAVVNSS